LPFDKCPVGLADRAVSELRADSLSRAHMPGKNKSTRRGTIHAMRDTQIDIRVGRFAFLLTIVFLDPHLHAVNATWRLSEYPRLFVDNQAGAILIKNF
jgi:hypothetical protein